MTNQIFRVTYILTTLFDEHKYDGYLKYFRILKDAKYREWQELS